MKSIARFFVWCVSMAFVLSLASCKEQISHGLLDTVPSDAKVVASIDLDKFFKEAGCEVASDKVTLTDDLNTVLEKSGLNTSQRLFVKRLAKSGVVSLDEVLYFSNGAKKECLTFKINGLQQFCDFVELNAIDYSAREERDGYVYYCGAKDFIVANEYQGWIIQCRSYDIISDLQLMLSKADESAIADVAWKASFLSQDKILSSLIDDAEGKIAEYCGVAEDLRAVVGLNIDASGDKFTADICAYTADGKSLSLSRAFSKIDTSFLKYLYPNDVAAVAVGVRGDTDWKMLYENIKPLLPREYRIGASVLIPYMEDLDGTVVIAGGPIAGAQSISQYDAETWEFLVIAPLKDGKAVEVYDEVKAMAAPFVDIENTETGMSGKLGGVTYYLSVVDGSLMFSNREIVERGDTRLSAEQFEGKAVAMVGDIAYKSELMRALDLTYGVDLSLTLDSDRMRLRTRLNGGSTTILKAYFAMLAKNTK